MLNLFFTVFIVYNFHIALCNKILIISIYNINFLKLELHIKLHCNPIITKNSTIINCFYKFKINNDR